MMRGRLRRSRPTLSLLLAGLGAAVCIAAVAAGGPSQTDRRPSVATAPLPVAPTDCEVRDGVFLHGSRQSNDVALSFDTCPTSHTPPFSPEMVETLVRAQVPATFFVSGRWAEAHPDALRQLTAGALFEIGLHGHRHRHLRGLGLDAIAAEIDDGRRALLRLGATPAPLFRPPFGDLPPALGEAARRTGVVPVLWDAVSGDPDPDLPPATLARHVLRQVRGGSIVVMHANGRGIASAVALPDLIVTLRERGFRFVTVGTLVRACGVAIPPAIGQTNGDQ